jgi:ESS family glutamate:Na+ symporter
MELEELFHLVVGSEELKAILLQVCILCLLLGLGKFLRVKIKLFQNIFIPASVIAGFIGLILGPFLLGKVLPFEIISEEIRASWYSYAGVLINIIFACLLLGVRLPSLREIGTKAGPQISFGVIMGGMGDYVVGCILTALILIPLFHVDPTFATLIEIGFSGGHGTAGGMMNIFIEGIPGTSWKFPAGADLAMTSATVGILSAVIMGMWLINIAARKGYCRSVEKPEKLPKEERIGIVPKGKEKSIAKGTVSSSSIEPLAFIMIFIGISILIGWLIVRGLKAIHPFLGGIPMFPFCMIGGIIVQWLMVKLRIDYLIDRASVERIMGLALDFLVVAAIASIKIPVVVEYAAPFFLLMAAAITYNTVLTWYLAPRMLPDAWFERGITEYGMQCGVTATGLVLLRIVDPGYRTPAAEAFAFKQIAYEPFIGGGLFTCMTPIIVVTLGLKGLFGMAAGTIAIFLIITWICGWFHPHPGPYKAPIL